jgi:Uma2 family endonuclease
MSMTSQTVEQALSPVEYPSEDGEPMAETEIHVLAIFQLYELLRDLLGANRPQDYVAANMFWYWEEGNPKARRAPDVMVIKGVGPGPRRSFFSWRENNAVPCCIVEMASESTWRENLYEKRRLYAELGVREYVIFDPENLYLRPPLCGYRLDAHGRYVMLELDGEDRLHSEELGVYLRAEGTMLRLIDAGTGQPILTREERLEQERRRADELQAENARLRAELKRAGDGAGGAAAPPG